MKKIKSFLVLGAMAMASSMAWAQGTTSNADCVDALPTEASKQAYVLSTPRGTLIGTENQYLQATDLPANNTAYTYDKTNGAFQFLLFPAEGQTNGYYIYSVGAEKFLGARTTANTDGSHTAGVATMTANAPVVYYIWKHGQTGSDGNGYGTNYSKQEWPWTIGAAVRTSGQWNTINMTHWNNGVGYDFGPTGNLDAGNAYAIVPAAVVSDEVYQAAYEILHPSAPAEPYVFTTEIKNKNTYALVNVQETGHNWYLKNVGGVLTPADASACNAATEWEEDAQFVAELQSDGVFAFKNVANGQYLAWKGTASRADNTGANGNKGFVDEVNTYSTWTMHNGTRFADTFWFVAKRNNGNDGSLILKGDNGAWDAWGNTENVSTNSVYNAAYSNNYGFVLVKEYVEPIFTTDKLYTLKNEKDNRGYLALNPEIDYVGLADVTLAPQYASKHTSSLNNGVSIAWQLEENGEGQVALRNVINGKYLGKGAVVEGQGGVWSDTPLYFTYEAAEDAGAYHLKVDGQYLCPACGWTAAQGAVRFVDGHENAVDLVIAETESVPVHVGEAGFATLYVDKDVAAPFGVTAYLLSDCGTYLAAKDAPSFRSETGVVLAAAEGDYLFPVVPNAGVNNSDLTGTLVEMAAPTDCLVLGKEDGEVGFYSFTGTLAANKAYFVKPAASNLRISFDELTSIISAAQQNGGQAIFDLQGRRVVNAQNGLYIVNGKKVIR